MKTAFVALVVVVTASLIGCVLDVETDDSENTQSSISNNTDADAGSDSALEAGADAKNDIPQCKTDCDCFDDNVCTLDSCINGVCQNGALEGSCGSTVGWCRGSWCCTSETTCFQAYDNDNSLCP